MDKIPVTTENIQRWATFLKRIRHFFDERKYFEVTTPHVVAVGAFEGTIDTLKVHWNRGHAELHSSPEISMKSILAEARLPIYQICQCFRDDLEGPHHAKEFTMLEWYSPGGTYKTVMEEMKELVRTLTGKDIAFETLPIDGIFLRYLDISLSDCSSLEKFKEQITQRKLIQFDESDTWEDLFFRLMLEKIEPSLNPEIPTFIYNYPTRVSPLSEQISGSLFAERFELYWKGMELCNGCTELTDVGELKRRALKENETRKLLEKRSHPVPDSLFEALPKLGNTAGVAAGLDRLFRCLDLPA